MTNTELTVEYIHGVEWFGNKMVKTAEKGKDKIFGVAQTHLLSVLKSENIPVQLVVLRNNYEKRLWGQVSLNEIKDLLKTNIGLYEMLVAERKRKVYFDIDAPKGAVEDIDRLAEGKKLILSLMPDARLNISGNHEKKSYHITIDNYYLENLNECEGLKQFCLKHRNIFDPCIYTTNRMMKCINQSKPNKLVQGFISGNLALTSHLITAVFPTDCKDAKNIFQHFATVEIKPKIKIKVSPSKQPFLFKDVEVKQLTELPVKLPKFTDEIKQEIKDLLTIIDCKKRADDRNFWVYIGTYLRVIGINFENALDWCFEAFNDFSKHSDKYEGRNACLKEWGSFAKYDETANYHGIQKLKEIAKEDNFEAYKQKYYTYEDIKKEFELTHCKILVGAIFVAEYGGKICFLSRSDMRQNYENMFYVKTSYSKDGEKHIEEVPFIDRWFVDKTIKTYQEVDYIPPPAKCPANVYNLYQGLEGEKYKEIMGGDCSLLVEHLRLLAGEDEMAFNYFIKWLAQIVQQPGKLSNTAVVLKSEEGVGKNIFFDWFGKRILGNHQFYMTADGDRLFAKFNEQIRNKLLINLDETKSSTTFKQSEQIKNFITATEITIEKKGKDAFTMHNYARWLFTTNNNVPVKIGMNDRRFVIFQCSNKMKNNDKYFTELADALDDDAVVGAFYRYLMEVDLTGFSFINDRPKNELYYETQSVNVPVVYRFLDDFCMQHTAEVVRMPAQSLFTMYQEYRMKCNLKDEGSTISKFSRELKGVTGVEVGVKMDGGSKRGYVLTTGAIKSFLEPYEKFFI